LSDMTSQYRLDPVAQEQLAAQIVAVMNAHFKRPSAGEKTRILQLASEQIMAEVEDQDMEEQASLDRADEASR
jgi:hypothetical protein